MDHKDDIYKLAMIIINRGQSHKIVKRLMKEKIMGWTIVYGEGSVDKELCESIFGIEFAPEKEVILVIEKAIKIQSLLTKVTKVGKLTEPGTGIALVINLKEWYGLRSLLNIEERCD
jgi:nitrogen regulatory protein PII